MSSSNDIKRLFFGAQVSAPWPETYPEGRLISEESRHLTLGFLGNIPFSPLQQKLDDVPKPTFNIGPVGYFDQCLFLPPRNPRVVSWHVKWFVDDALATYQKSLTSWLEAQGYEMDKRDFLPHLTVARKPFIVNAWKKAFDEIPMMVQAIHLYESFPKLEYKPIWSYPLVHAFEEIEHTADRAFLVRGRHLGEIFIHAQLALAYVFPPMLPFVESSHETFDRLESVIEMLNQLNARVDKEMGSPLKAISYAGELKTLDAGMVEWEMICDI